MSESLRRGQEREHAPASTEQRPEATAGAPLRMSSGFGDMEESREENIFRDTTITNINQKYGAEREPDFDVGESMREQLRGNDDISPRSICYREDHSRATNPGYPPSAGEGTEGYETRTRIEMLSSTPAATLESDTPHIEGDRRTGRFSTNGAQRGARFDDQREQREAYESTVTFPRREEREWQMRRLESGSQELAASLQEKEVLMARLEEETKEKQFVRETLEHCLREQENEREMVRRNFEAFSKILVEERESERETFKNNLTTIRRDREVEQEVLQQERDKERATFNLNLELARQAIDSERIHAQKERELLRTELLNSRTELATVRRLIEAAPTAPSAQSRQWAPENEALSRPTSMTVGMTPFKLVNGTTCTLDAGGTMLALPRMLSYTPEAMSAPRMSARVAGNVERPVAVFDTTIVTTGSFFLSEASTMVDMTPSTITTQPSAYSTPIGELSRTRTPESVAGARGESPTVEGGVTPVIQQQLEAQSSMLKQWFEQLSQIIRCNNEEKTDEKDAKVVANKPSVVTSPTTIKDAKEGKTGVVRHRSEMRLDKFNGQPDTWSAFLIELDNCAVYNAWTDAEKLSQLKHALKGNANQVLWIDALKVWTFDELVETLTKRFGNSGQSAMYRAELTARRKGKNESLYAVEQDIRRLMALAHEDPQSKTSKELAVDAFIRALDDREIAGKVQELEPKDLDEALRQALRFEAYAKNKALETRDTGLRNRREEGAAKAVTNQPTEESTETPAGVSKADKDDSELRKLLLQLIKTMSASAVSAPPPVPGPGFMPPYWYPMAPPMQPLAIPAARVVPPVTVAGVPETVSNERERGENDRGGYNRGSDNRGGNDRRRDDQGDRSRGGTFRCYNCGEMGHISRNCPSKTQNNMLRARRSLRHSDDQLLTDIQAVLKDERNRTYLRMELFGKEHVCLLDSGCSKTVVPPEVAAGLPIKGVSMSMTAANGADMEVYGEADIPFSVMGTMLPAASLVSPDVDEVLIGADWMKRYKLKWNFEENEVEVQGVRASLEDRGTRYLCRRIVSEMSVGVPAHREMVVLARYVMPTDAPVSTRRWMTEETEIDCGLRIRGIELPEKRCQLPILVKNDSDETVWIKEGFDLATAVPTEAEVGVVRVKSPIVTPTGIRNGKKRVRAKKSAIRRARNRFTRSAPVGEKDVIRGYATANDDPFGHVDSLVDDVEGLSGVHEKKELRKLLRNYTDVFSSGEFDLGATDLARHTINTGDARPVKQALRPQPRAQLQSIDDQTKEMEKAGLIEPSNSPWVSNVVMVTKKDGSPRFCIDYRRLNDLTIKDAYPLPRIESCLDAMAGAKFFSTFDLRSGYHQVMMDPRDADKTSFVTRTGTYKFKVMPFGLCNAGATFQRVMDVAMRGLNFKVCIVYLDDIVVFSKTLEEHMTNLAAVLQRLREAGLKLKPSKCRIARTKVEFLGHVVSDQGVATDPAKVKDVANWPIPQNATEVRSFLGLASYYRKFVPNFAHIAAPLHSLTGKNAQFRWSAECEEAMKVLQEKLMSAPILAMPRDDGMYTLDTDASDFAIGAILSQQQDGEEKVIAYVSRKLSGPELNYCVTRKELLAVVHFTKQFRQYLLGRKFSIRTDHAALQWLRKTPTPIGQQARWLDIMGEFDFDIIHRPGRCHQNADALSRKPCRQCGAEAEVEMNGEETTRICTIHLGDVYAVEDSPWAAEVMAADTLSDPELKIVVGWIEDPNSIPAWHQLAGESGTLKMFFRMLDRLRLHDGVLFREWYTSEGNHSHWQLVVPENRRIEFVTIAHGAATGGHLGTKKTYEQVRRRAFWPNLNREVEYVLKRCPQCAAYHRGKLPRKGTLQPMKVGETWERLSIDVTGPHPKSKSGKVYILTMVDHHSKWAEAFAVSNHEAVTVGKILTEQVFPRFGVPKQILSDRGTEFEGKLMTELCKAMGIDKLRTTAYKPSTNGVVERFHRTLNSMVGKVVSENQRDWDDFLPMVMAAYRATKHDATGFSPNCLMLGREVRAPLDLVYDMPVSEEDRHDSYEAFVFDYQRRSRSAHRLVREHLKKAAERNKDYYDMRVRPTVFSVGTWVYFYNPRRYQGRSPKWQKMFSGPYLVMEEKGPVNVVIQMSARSKPFIVHIDKLKVWLGDHPKSWIKSDVVVQMEEVSEGEVEVCPEKAAEGEEGEQEKSEWGRLESHEASGRLDLPPMNDSLELERSDVDSQADMFEAGGGCGGAVTPVVEDSGTDVEGDMPSPVDWGMEDGQRILSTPELEEIQSGILAGEGRRPRRNIKKPARYADRVLVIDDSPALD
jgi:transposase InsO family protein